jgi:hypothetical protein
MSGTGLRARIIIMVRTAMVPNPKNLIACKRQGKVTVQNERIREG